MNISDIPTAARAKLVVVETGDKLIHAAWLLTSGADILVVHDQSGVLQGVVTKTDIVRQMSKCQGIACHGPVSGVMTRDVVKCHEGDGLQDILGRMQARNMKNIPVVDAENRPIGLLTARAILRTLLGEAEEVEAQLVGYVSGIGYR